MGSWFGCPAGSTARVGDSWTIDSFCGTSLASASDSPDCLAMPKAMFTPGRRRSASISRTRLAIRLAQRQRQVRGGEGLALLGQGAGHEDAPNAALLLRVVENRRQPSVLLHGHGLELRVGDQLLAVADHRLQQGLVDGQRVAERLPTSAICRRRQPVGGGRPTADRRPPPVAEALPGRRHEGLERRARSTATLAGGSRARFIASPIRLMPSSEEREPSPLSDIGEQAVGRIGGRQPAAAAAGDCRRRGSRAAAPGRPARAIAALAPTARAGRSRRRPRGSGRRPIVAAPDANPLTSALSQITLMVRGTPPERW